MGRDLVRVAIYQVLAQYWPFIDDAFFTLPKSSATTRTVVATADVVVVLQKTLSNYCTFPIVSEKCACSAKIASLF